MADKAFRTSLIGPSEDLKENDIEKQHNNFRQITATFFVCYLCISCGNFLAFTSTAIPSMKNDESLFGTMDDHDISWIGGLGPLGAMVGAVFTVLPIGRFGSRRTIGYFAAPAMLLSWITIALSQSLYTIYLGRFLGGFASGIIIPCSPLYVIDISSVVRRGKVGIIPQFLMIFGILLSYTLGSFLEWRSLSIACTIIATPCFMMLSSWAPDSPKWLIARKQSDRAHEILERLQGPTEALVSFQKIVDKMNREQIFRERKSPLTRAMFKSSAIVFGIMSFQQLTGINGVTFYSVHIFQQSAGDSVWGGHIPSIILAVVQCIASFSSSLIVERAGRKVLLLISASLTSLAAIILGIYFYFGLTVQFLFWVPLAALILFVFAFAIGFGPITWILCAELLAEETRHIINPLAIAYNWFCVFVVTKSFPLLVMKIEIYGVFFLYALFGVFGVVFIALFVPETKGKTLDEIRSYFGYEVDIDSDNNSVCNDNEAQSLHSSQSEIRQNCLEKC